MFVTMVWQLIFSLNNPYKPNKFRMFSVRYLKTTYTFLSTRKSEHGNRYTTSFDRWRTTYSRPSFLICTLKEWNMFVEKEILKNVLVILVESLLCFLFFCRVNGQNLQILNLFLGQRRDVRGWFQQDFSITTETLVWPLFACKLYVNTHWPASVCVSD